MKRGFNSLIIEVIVGIILILYILFLYMDFYNVKTIISSSHIKYLCVILCFLLSILQTKNSQVNTVKQRDNLLLQWGLLITMIADFCLVILEFYILGVLFFILVQITYCVRYTNKNIKIMILKLFISFVFIVISYAIALLFIEEINSLVPISLFYVICLLTSVIKAVKASIDNLYTAPGKYMIVFGMILFLLCDICVALSNIIVMFPLSRYKITRFQTITYFLIWVFYVPSQLLLSLSGNAKILKINIKK